VARRGANDGGWNAILKNAILEKTIPEPGTVTLLGLGLLGSGLIAHRRRRAA
jgi:hypothetical protein